MQDQEKIILNEYIFILIKYFYAETIFQYSEAINQGLLLLLSQYQGIAYPSRKRSSGDKTIYPE